MKNIKIIPWLIGLIMIPAVAIPQSGGNFIVTKSVIAGGGGNASGGIFILDGTIGQSAAGTVSTGGAFELGSGFWGIGSTLPAPTFSISGRVTTPTGLGLRNAIVILIDQQGVPIRATTSSFGLYSFQGVAQGSYFVGVSSKRYRFATRIVGVFGNLTNVDFVGLE